MAGTQFVLASTGAHNGRAFCDSAVAGSSVHGGQRASAPFRSICCPQVGAPNFREFAWEGDSTVLDTSRLRVVCKAGQTAHFLDQICPQSTLSMGRRHAADTIRSRFVRPK